MGSKILVSDIAAKSGAIDDDVRALDAQWQRMIRIDDDGSCYVDAANQSYLHGALYATADRRKSARIQTADARLVETYGTLKAATAPKSRAGQAAWQAQMVTLFTEARDALVELVDAKVDAKAMQPAIAEALRTQAARVLRDAERNATRTLRQLRALSRAT